MNCSFQIQCYSIFYYIFIMMDHEKTLFINSKIKYILLEHGTISLKSTTCEASTQRTHLTILAEVWCHLILLEMLVLICSWCTVYHLRFSRTRPDGVENPLQRVWSFLSSFIWRITSSGYQNSYLPGNKNEACGNKKPKEKLDTETEKQAYHKPCIVAIAFCICFHADIFCSLFSIL
jgi:hypothetical protein